MELKKKKKRGRRKNTLLPDSNCFIKKVSEAQAHTGLYKRPITSKLYDCSLARITILFCCYLSSPKQPETEISFTDFYCYLLTKTLCLLSYAGEKRVLSCLSFRTVKPGLALLLTSCITLVKTLSISFSICK